jgi:hypothetical protein
MVGRDAIGVVVGLGLLTAVAAPSCSKSSESGIAGNCSINSDCDAPLVCAFGRCHSECAESRDCTSGERCVISTAGGGVCQLTQESTCSGGAFCEVGEVCGVDEQCRVSCTTSGVCTKGDYCLTTGAAGACYSASNTADQAALIAAGVLAADGAVLGDASVIVVDGSGGSSGVGPQDGSGSSGGSSGGDGTVATSACPSAQTQFGFTAQGDTNASFTSGVGLRTASGMLVFSGYAGPPTGGFTASGDGGTTVNLVYVQSFDPGQGTTTSQAQPLFQAPAGTNFFVYGAAIAPTGQIALVYGYNDCCTMPNLPFFDYVYPYESFYGAGIYAAFLDSSPDAGSPGVTLARTVPLETGEYLGQPHVIWSAATQSFVFSWHSQPTNGSGVAIGQGVATVQKFLVTGAAAGGDTDVVPTNDSTGEVLGGNNDQGAVGVSGSLFGVVYETGAPNGVGGRELPYPFLTLLDAQGNLVGSTIQISSVSTNGANWITIAGTAQGFVYLYDNSPGVTGAFIPVSGGAAVLPVDGGAGFQPIAITGTIEATSADAIADDTPAGGVGVALLYANGVSFAYVNPDGSVKLQPNRVFAHTYVVNDEYSVGVFGGSFALALYDSVAHSTQIAASGCQ